MWAWGEGPGKLMGYCSVPIRVRFQEANLAKEFLSFIYMCTHLLWSEEMSYAAGTINPQDQSVLKQGGLSLAHVNIQWRDVGMRAASTWNIPQQLVRNSEYYSLTFKVAAWK